MQTQNVESVTALRMYNLMDKINDVRYGWICPRCKKVWSPYIESCDCNECTVKITFPIAIPSTAPVTEPYTGDPMNYTRDTIKSISINSVQ